MWKTTRIIYSPYKGKIKDSKVMKEGEAIQATLGMEFNESNMILSITMTNIEGATKET
jgi:hypothetical protein